MRLVRSVVVFDKFGFVSTLVEMWEFLLPNW
jgi:hypothetical protein